jgi:hypothetical protein
VTGNSIGSELPRHSVPPASLIPIHLCALPQVAGAAGAESDRREERVAPPTSRLHGGRVAPNLHAWMLLHAIDFCGCSSSYTIHVTSTGTLYVPEITVFATRSTK